MLDINIISKFENLIKLVIGENGITNIDILDKDYKDEYIVIDDNGQSKAVWIDINEFKNGNKILYPEEVFKYI